MQQGFHSVHNRTDLRLRASSANPHASGGRGELFGEMNRDHQNRNPRKQLQDLFGCLKSVQFRIWKSSKTTSGSVRCTFCSTSPPVLASSQTCQPPRCSRRVRRQCRTVGLSSATRILTKRESAHLIRPGVELPGDSCGEAAFALRWHHTGGTPWPASVRVRHYVRGGSAPFFVASFCVLLEHCPSRHFFGSSTVASRALGAFLDVLVLALFLRAYAAQVLFNWHSILLHAAGAAAAIYPR